MSPSDSVGDRCSEIEMFREKEKEEIIKQSFFQIPKFSLFILKYEMCHTGAEYLRQDAFLVSAVDVVGCFPGFVGAVQQAAVLRVPQQQLGQLSAPPSDGNVQRCVSFLSAGKKRQNKTRN